MTFTRQDDGGEGLIADPGQCNNSEAADVYISVGTVVEVVSEAAVARSGDGLARSGEARSEQRAPFSEVASRHLGRLYSLARPLVGDQAEDAVQDCLLKAFRAYDKLRDPAAAGAWLSAILVNCCRDRARGWDREPAPVDTDELEEFTLFGKIADEDPFPYSDSLHLDFLHQFGREDVQAVLLELPEIYRVPLVLVHMQGFATKEVARMLDVPLGTILARLHRGRKQFERQLWDHAERNGLLKTTKREDEP